MAAEIHATLYQHDCGHVTALDVEPKEAGSVYCPHCMMFRPQSEFKTAPKPDTKKKE